MFCIYPAVSVASMQVLNCDLQIGEAFANPVSQQHFLRWLPLCVTLCLKYAGRLKADYREICFGYTMYTYGYSIAFILLYPIGIPVIMNLACRRNGIVSIVTKKMELAKFNAMISLFVKNSTSLEAQRVARLIGCRAVDRQHRRGRE